MRTGRRSGAWALIAGGLVVALGAHGFLQSQPSPSRAQRPDRWTVDEQTTLESMRLSRLPDPRPDPSNAFEASPEAYALGKRLFADSRLSRNGLVSCASCHSPGLGFQDDRPVGRGVSTGNRRTMPVVASAHSPWLFWDGRKDSLWSQALGPLEDATEHGANRTRLVRLLQDHYRLDYERVFGPLPALQGIPYDASPLGTVEEKRAWSTMSDAQKKSVNRAFANLGKAIAAFERTLTYGESRFDRYVDAVRSGDVLAQEAMTPQEVRGLRLFIGRGQCSTCHSGPLFTDHSFHNTGVPSRNASSPDRGRALAVARVLEDEFNCLGPYSDAPRSSCQELAFIASDEPGMEGAFKTPSLRNVGSRLPYMHAGQFSTLEEAVLHYARSPAAAVGHSELAHKGEGHGERQPIRLANEDVRDLVAFLKTLSVTAHTTKTDATHGPGFPGKVPLALRPKLMLPVQLKLVLSARFK